VFKDLVDTINAFRVGGYLILHEEIMASDIPINLSDAFAKKIWDSVEWDRSKDLLISLSEHHDGVLIRWKPLEKD